MLALFNCLLYWVISSLPCKIGFFDIPLYGQGKVGAQKVEKLF